MYFFRTWKNSKRDGKGLMIYANGDIYEGSWQNDLKHGYGILEKKSGDKYYGFWNNGLKEGQGYYYYSSTAKIYLGEWHEDAPRCGIFTDVDDESLPKEFKKHFKAADAPPLIPALKLKSPEGILEESISNVHFIRLIKLAKSKTLQELYPYEMHQELMSIFTQRKYLANNEEDSQSENRLPDSVLSVKDFTIICDEKLGVTINDEILELIFYIFEMPLDEQPKIDFLLFARLFYLISSKYLTPEDAVQEDGINVDEVDVSAFADEKMKEIELLTNGIDKVDKKGTMNFDYSEYKDEREYVEDSHYESGEIEDEY